MNETKPYPEKVCPINNQSGVCYCCHEECALWDTKFSCCSHLSQAKIGQEINLTLHNILITLTHKL